MQLFLGLDIGTTSLSLVVLDIENGNELFKTNIQHESRNIEDLSDEYTLNPDKILNEALKLVFSAVSQYPDIQGIGITGQMHGIILVNGLGRAVSPVYTWLDMRSTRQGADGMSPLSAMAMEMGKTLPPGYGAATLFALERDGMVPDSAAAFCTMPDYAAMNLVGRSQPVTDPALGHSLGFFDIDTESFQLDIWKKITSLNLPEVLPSTTMIGLYNGRIPVTVATGDNQASFLASVRDPERAILINIGTSGQIACLESKKTSPINPQLDIRPFPTGEKLIVGASLSGGKSFDVLADLIADIVNRAVPDTRFNPYDVIDSFETADDSRNSLIIDTSFAGTRLDPSRTGTIEGITLKNFTIEQLYWGFSAGMIRELRTMLEPEMTPSSDAYTVISGNSIVKNRSLQLEIAKQFNTPVMMPRFKESAARGAALIASARAHPAQLHELAVRVITYDTMPSG